MRTHEKREVPARPLVERGDRDQRAKRIGIMLKQNQHAQDRQGRLFAEPPQGYHQVWTWTEAARRRLAGCLWR